MLARIKKNASYYELTSTAFADRIEVPRPVVSHIFSERNRPSLEVVQKIGIAFPEVNLEWLLYEKGEMLKKVAGKGKEEDIRKPVEASPVLIQDPIKPEPVPSKNTIISEVKAGQENIKSKGRKTMKIVFFYDDHSLEEFLP